MFHVKQPFSHLPPHEIVAALAAVDICVTFHQAEQLSRHASLVLEANEHINLTRITAPADILELHIMDSLLPLARITMPSGPLVDIGSGAGFPGIPLAVMGHTVTLCESVKKKALFLGECVTSLGLDCDVIPLRAEELAQTARDRYAGVIARAVSALPSLVELASPLLRPGGCLIALKGRLETIECERADRAAAQCGMSRTETVAYSLPRGDARTIAVFVKSGSPRVRLPRRPGLAQRHPLA